jgi:hypothetical protein
VKSLTVQETSVIHSNANLDVHGLNLLGSGDTIEAQRLILSLFYSIKVRRIMLIIYLITLELHQVMYIPTTDVYIYWLIFGLKLIL